MKIKILGFSEIADIINAMLPVSLKNRYEDNIVFPQICNITTSTLISDRDKDLFHIIDVRLKDNTLLQFSMTHFICDFIKD